jgi:undecaprenyl-diphosphatase
MDFLAGLDVSIYRAINGLCGTSPFLDRLVYHFEPLRGVLFMGIFGLLWFRQDSARRRTQETLILTIPAVVLALAANRIISTLLPFRERPMYALGANPPSFTWAYDLENWSSFPSDNASYLFAIATMLWFISRPVGAVFGVFGAFAVLGRVYLGIHYPSDILVGALLGVACAFAINREAIRRHLADPLLAFETRTPAYFYGLLLCTLAEVETGFQNTRRVAVAVIHIFTGFHGV